MFIFAGAAGWWFASPRENTVRGAGFVAIRGLVALAVLLSAVEAVWFWPNYLAYFNLLIGGPRNGYKHLVDSSLDWTQDVKELKRWLDAHPTDSQPPRQVYVSLFGSTPLKVLRHRRHRIAVVLRTAADSITRAACRRHLLHQRHRVAKCAARAVHRPLEQAVRGGLPELAAQRRAVSPARLPILRCECK